MALTASNMLALGSALPRFALPDGHGVFHADSELAGPKGLLVIFICNHCPYVKHINAALAPMGEEFAALGVGMVAISANDIAQYPDDAPEHMVEVARAEGYTFPYLYDETQAVAREFGAACTPDLFLFDMHGRLVYRGQFDDTRPGGAPATGEDIRHAVHALSSGHPVVADQRPSIGCGIKWKQA
ncbi:thioredoxin family protein [Chitiniphilus shinanonensis]|uniref:Thioredoxin family protein n=1 Tax=Chitiniphilus shinanonensis TaxID=553088 RepID=A0ABQ6BMN2_9NEIS|nr:thioredoxin family protein [Chitiniphilus shinanonensis]GLS02909.1 thioredoxin family protein [Chitiniphilus shinanonensis]